MKSKKAVQLKRNGRCAKTSFQNSFVKPIINVIILYLVFIAESAAYGKIA